MKTFRFMAILGLCVSLFTFTACGDDDDNNNNNNQQQNNQEEQVSTGIEGIWTYDLAEPNPRESRMYNVTLSLNQGQFVLMTTQMMVYGDGEDTHTHGYANGYMGSYTYADGKLKLNATKGGSYDIHENNEEEELEWYDLEKDAFEVELTAALNGDKLVLNTIENNRNRLDWWWAEEKMTFSRSKAVK